MSQPALTATAPEGQKKAAGRKIRDFFNRFKQKMQQKFGKAEKTVDEEFNATCGHFIQSAKFVDNITRGVKNWLRVTEDFLKQSKRLAEEFDKFYDTGSPYKQAAIDLVTTLNEAAQAYYAKAHILVQKECEKPLEQLRKVYDELLGKIGERNNRVLEFDYYRNKVARLEKSVKPKDKARLPRNREKLHNVSSYFTQLNAYCIAESNEQLAVQYRQMNRQFVMLLNGLVQFIIDAREAMYPAERHMQEMDDSATQMTNEYTSPTDY